MVLCQRRGLVVLEGVSCIISAYLVIKYRASYFEGGEIISPSSPPPGFLNAFIGTVPSSAHIFRMWAYLHQILGSAGGGVHIRNRRSNTLILFICLPAAILTPQSFFVSMPARSLELRVFSTSVAIRLPDLDSIVLGWCHVKWGVRCTDDGLAAPRTEQK